MALMATDLLALFAGLTVIRLLPPLTITEAKLDEMISELLKVLAKSREPIRRRCRWD